MIPKDFAKRLGICPDELRADMERIQRRRRISWAIGHLVGAIFDAFTFRRKKK